MKRLQLILTNPCSEQWDDMRTDGTGRYCDSCEKHIVDLSTKSDAELIQFFKKKKDNVCGRLLPGQLNRPLAGPVPKTSWHWLLPFTLSAIAVTPIHAANGLIPAMQQNDQAIVFPPASIESIALPQAAAITISGTVLDLSTGKPLKGVKVRQKGFENVLALTDSTGRFKLGAAEENSLFTFELSGYFKAESKLTDSMVVKLDALRIMLGGISTISSHQEPLYMIYAGNKSCSINALKLSEIPSDWIEKVEVLKDAKATALYGAKAANGVVLIGIKKAYAKKIDFSNKK